MQSNKSLIDVARLRKELIEKWGHLECRENTSGGVAIGRLPELGPQWYLQRIYNPASLSDIENWSSGFNIDIPNNWVLFLQQANGLSLFRSLSFYGVVSSNPRDPSDVVGQPVSLRYGNSIEILEPVPSSHFCIGSMTGYSGKGELYLTATNRVELWKSGPDSICGAKWESVEELLRTEIDRLNEFHNEAGMPTVDSSHFLPQDAARWEDDASRYTPKKSTILSKLWRR